MPRQQRQGGDVALDAWISGSERRMVMLCPKFERQEERLAALRMLTSHDSKIQRRFFFQRHFFSNLYLEELVGAQSYILPSSLSYY